LNSGLCLPGDALQLEPLPQLMKQLLSYKIEIWNMQCFVTFVSFQLYYIYGGNGRK
jgi:hypothetical protein